MKKNKLKILMLAAELTPIAKVGGLGDVIGALPKALAKLGADIRICLPFYGSIDLKRYPVKKISASTFSVKGKSRTIGIYETPLPGTGIPIYLIKHEFFDPKEIYACLGPMKASRYVDNTDDLARFTFFSQAAVEAVKALGFRPDIIHANDWHVALVPQLIKAPANKDHFSRTKTVYTIHNLAAQGIAQKRILDFVPLDTDSGLIKTDLKNGEINLMAQGILSSDAVTTVSPTYAREILSGKMGAGLSRVLKKRRNDLYGIINGIDTELFDPKTDASIRKNYSLKTVSRKRDNKLSLQEKLGLAEDAAIPLVGFVTRFVWQKGTDLITAKFKDLPCQFAFLGSGEKKYEDHLLELAGKYPDKFSTTIGFDAALAQQIYAGCDIFLVPSRFEPCGLTQMIAMRYGSIPVVRATGGLADTVDANVGFTFKNFHSRDLYKTLRQALSAYRHPEKWRRLQAEAMKKDFSWSKSAKEYLKLYNKLLN